MKAGIIVSNSKEARALTGEIVKKLQELSISPMACADDFFDTVPDSGLYTCSEIARQADIIISVGGDGTFLRSAHIAMERETPVLGVNLGKVGYLTEIEPDELSELARVAKGDYIIERRMMLNASIHRDGKVFHSFNGLNDAVIKNGHIARILDFYLYCDGKPVGAFRADGVLASTPTGSTAYSLAAGGPVIDPAMSCLLILALCPHSLHMRPILFSDKSRLELSLGELSDKDAYLSVDGRDSVKTLQGDKIIFEKAKKVTKVIRLNDHSFNETLNLKFRRRGERL